MAEFELAKEARIGGNQEMAELQEISKNMHTLMREVEAKLSRQIVIKAQPNGARFRFVALIDDCTLI